ncbi:MAG: hypothetical protein NVSMB21_00110 [Vulcanimicrobiaceae bacterium]
MATGAASAGRRRRPLAVAGALPRVVIEYGWRRTLITLAIVTATLLEIVDVTIVNVALPNIQGNFGASVDQAAWIGTGYIIANVIVIPITPWLQQRFGRRQYYAASIVVFTVASIACGLAQSLEQLIFWRIVQGLGGGGLISTSQAILRETYPAREQGKAMGIFSMGVIVGPTVGPTLGGFITDQFSWRWAFFINVLPGILALAVVLLMLRNPARPRKLPLDYVGLGLLALGIGSLQYVLDQGQQKDWFDDRSIVVCACTAVLGSVAFLVWELRQRDPVVDLGVLRYRSVATGSILGMVLGISLYGSVLILPQYVQGSLGFTATLSGELLVFRAGAVLLLTPIAAMLASRNRIDSRWLVACGFTLVGISNFMLAAVTTSQSSFWTFFGALFVSGLGLAQIFVPLTLSVLGAVAPRDIPGASAFFNLARQIGGSVAIALLVTLLARANATHHTELASQIRLAKINADLSDDAARLSASNTVDATLVAYYNLVAAWKNVAIQEDALRQARAQSLSNARLVRGGVAAPVDVVESDSTVAVFQDDVFAAIANVASLQNALKALMLDDPADPMWTANLVPTSPLTNLVAEPAIPDIVAAALRTRPEVAQLRESIRAQDVETAFARDGRRPQLDLTLGVSESGFAGTPTRPDANPFNGVIGAEITAINQLIARANATAPPGSRPLVPLAGTFGSPLSPGSTGGLGSSYASLLGAKYPQYTLGATLAFPLRDRTADATYASELERRRALETREVALIQRVQLEARNAVQAYRSARSRLIAASAARDAAERVAASEGRKFRAGGSTTFLVLQRQVALASQRGRELQAQSDVQKAVVELDRVSGAILANNNVNVETLGAGRKP